jgi:hypothetical protein
MPWKKAKALPPPDNSLFEACFRIQLEACEAAGRHIPLVVENVRGAQKWVGRSRWNFGSFHLWGDVPALMPLTAKTGGVKVPVLNWSGSDKPGYKAQAFSSTAAQRLTAEGVKQGGDWFNAECGNSVSRRCSSKSKARKRASAMIAKIPLTLSRHIAAVWHPMGSTEG